jgi:hypothetical protein
VKVPSNVYLITEGIGDTLRLFAALHKPDSYRVLTWVRSSDRHCCMNSGAVRARVNIKIAAELAHPGDHPWDANPRAERLPALVSGVFLRTPAVIANDQMQS